MRFFSLKIPVGILISAILLINPCQSKEARPYLHFSDFYNMKEVPTSDPSILRTHYSAKKKIAPHKTPYYKENDWHIVMRRGLFLAQVELAVSDIYRTLLGYSTEVAIVENKGDYFIARRDLSHFTKWYRFNWDPKNNVLYDKNNQYYLMPETNFLIQDSFAKRLTGLGKIAALTAFLGDTDAHSGNFGIQETDHDMRIVDTDLELSFNFRNAPPEWTRLEDTIPPEFLKMAWYVKEKNDMLKKIAMTDFSVFEKIIRHYVTATQADDVAWMKKKQQDNPSFSNDIVNWWISIETLPEDQNGVEYIIETLRARHEALRRQFQISSTT